MFFQLSLITSISRKIKKVISFVLFFFFYIWNKKYILIVFVSVRRMASCVEVNTFHSKQENPLVQSSVGKRELTADMSKSLLSGSEFHGFSPKRKADKRESLQHTRLCKVADKLPK